MAKEIPLTKGKVAIVDDADHEWLSRWSWTLNAYGYAVAHKTGTRRLQYMHRTILQPPDEYYTTANGRSYPKYLVDHIDGVPLNNQRSNLRLCTYGESSRNRKAFSTRKYSVYKGVFAVKGSNRNPWKACIYLDGKEIRLGCFPTQEAAALAYNEAALKLHGNFAYINVITDPIIPER